MKKKDNAGHEGKKFLKKGEIFEMLEEFEKMFNPSRLTPEEREELRRKVMERKKNKGGGRRFKVQ